MELVKSGNCRRQLTVTSPKGTQMHPISVCVTVTVAALPQRRGPGAVAAVTVARLATRCQCGRSEICVFSVAAANSAYKDISHCIAITWNLGTP
jgi:hypothetical protein